MSQHPKRSLLDSILYEYRCLGVVEKDGKKYKKYQRLPRLRTKHKRAILYTLLSVLILLGGIWLLRTVSEAVVSSLPSTPLVKPVQ
ncbi:MAG: hypothetical protein PHU21_15075 [Elusimicrobia bacterium]|jgi:hypothetical protein|nr:hypothetical protein [Elusimicrobiota bacterium]